MFLSAGRHPQTLGLPRAQQAAHSTIVLERTENHNEFLTMEGLRSIIEDFDISFGLVDKGKNVCGIESITEN